MISGPQDACALDCILVPPLDRIAYLSSLVSRLWFGTPGIPHWIQVEPQL